MQEATVQFAIRVRDLVVGFGRQVVIDHLALTSDGARSSGWSALPAAASRC